MITGAMNVTQLAKAYYYICSILYNNYSSIVQRNTLNTIKQLLKKERKEQQQNSSYKGCKATLIEEKR